MPGLYSARRHREELSSLSEEYETRLKELQAALTELKEENRRLSAEISLLRAQKQSISDAIIAAGEKREEMQRELDAFSAAQKALAVQAAEKAQRLLEDVRAAYPDEETSARFSTFEKRLKSLFEDGTDGAEPTFEEPSAEEGSSAVHTELTFSSAEPASDAGGDWDLKAVLETLGLSDD
jgi:hypothetical protein